MQGETVEDYLRRDIVQSARVISVLYIYQMCESVTDNTPFLCIL